MNQFKYLGFVCIFQSCIAMGGSPKLDLSDFVQMKLQYGNKGGGVVVTVGTIGSCDYASISEAINSGADEVRVSYQEGGYVENLLVDSVDLVIKGGYADCTDAQNDVFNGSLTTIDGGGVNSVIRVTTQDDTERVVILENLLLTNGSGIDANYPGGGLSVYDAALDMTIRNVEITGNTGISGGGLALVEGGSVDMLIEQSKIHANEADIGGGLYCHSGMRVVFDQSAGIYGNQASDTDGGGIYGEGGCRIYSYGGDDNALSGNSASRHGGGAYITDSAHLYLLGFQYCVEDVCFGDESSLVSVIGNKAQAGGGIDPGDGGAIFASGIGTLVNVFNADVSENSARWGGAFSVTNEAKLNIERSSSVNCDQCSRLIANDADVGGVLFMDSSAEATIKSSYVQNNRADVVTFASLSGASVLTIAGTVITNNGDNGVGFDDHWLMTSTDSELIVNYTTIADNHTDFISLIALTGGSLSINSSIVYESVPIDILSTDGEVDTSFDCLITHENVSINGATRSTVDDPLFIDPLNHDYHISPSSPAVDYCDESVVAAVGGDMDSEQWGWDDPNKDNTYGVFDIGADETYATDVIFEDDFEG